MPSREHTEAKERRRSLTLDATQARSRSKLFLDYYFH